MTDSETPDSKTNSTEAQQELLMVVGPHPGVGQLLQYIEKVKTFSTMNADEEKQCLNQVKNRLDEEIEAKRHLVQSNLGLVVKLARRNYGRGAALLDLIEEGNIALVLAIATFDYHSEQNFSSYVTWSIRKAMAKKIDSCALLTEPDPGFLITLNKLKRGSRELAREKSGKPTEEELCQAMGLTAGQLRDLLKLAQNPAPRSYESSELQAARNAEECAYMLECKAEMDQEDIESKARTREICREDLLREDLAEVMKSLSDPEKELVNLRFGLTGGKQHSLAEIAVMYNTTPHLVRELERSALRKLKRPKK